MDTIEVRLPIKLGQFLKLANIAETGAHARELIDMGDVYLNGTVEYQRGKTLHAGDTIAVDMGNSIVQLRVNERSH